jgi:glycosyltransferase involved in cell wall biosynthesis
MLVSVIIPTMNGAARLPALFAALEAQTLGRDQFEVLVVDDGSTDDTAAVVEASAIARLVQPPHNIGQGAATNLGIAHARGERIAFTDDDTVPAPDWLERGIAALDASPSGLVAGHVELVLDEQPSVAALMDYGRGYLDQSINAADGFGATANLWARPEVLALLEGFNEHAEWQTHDRDFGERAGLAGMTFAYGADVIVRHPTRDSARALARVTYRQGIGAGWLRSKGIVRGRSPEWRRVRYWIPWRSIWGLERLQARGHAVTLAERLKLRAVQYCCLQVPLVAGSLKASLHAARDGGR